MRQIRVYHRTKANGSAGRGTLLPQRISCGNLMLFAPSNETIFAYINFIYENHLHTHKHTQAPTRARTHLNTHTHAEQFRGPHKYATILGALTTVRMSVKLRAPFAQLFMHACVGVCVRMLCAL